MNEDNGKRGDEVDEEEVEDAEWRGDDGDEEKSWGAWKQVGRTNRPHSNEEFVSGVFHPPLPLWRSVAGRKTSGRLPFVGEGPKGTPIVLYPHTN